MDESRSYALMPRTRAPSRIWGGIFEGTSTRQDRARSSSACIPRRDQRRIEPQLAGVPRRAIASTEIDPSRAQELATRYVQVAELSNRFLQQANELDELRAELALKSEYARASQEVAEQWQSDFEALKHHYGELKTALGLAEAAAHEAINLQKKAEADAGASSALAATLQQKLATLELGKPELLAAVRKQLDAARDDRNKLSIELGHSSATIARLQTQLAEERARIRNLENSKVALASKSASLEKQLSGTIVQRDALEQQLAHRNAQLKSSNELLAERQAAIVALGQALVNEHSEKDALQTAFEHARGEILRLLPRLTAMSRIVGLK